MSVDWAAVPGLPGYVRAAMRALHLERPDLDGLAELSSHDWDALLVWLDRQQMTLLFGHACARRLPDTVAPAIGRRLEANRVRLAKLRAEYDAIAAALGKAGVPHGVLKGFTHGPPYVPAPELRPQYDLDLLVEPARLSEARRAIEGLGFEAVRERGDPPADHCAPLVRRTGWSWRGDYFDPEIPTVVELHHRLWDAATEGFDLPGLTAGDRQGYAAAHASRHLLRGSLKVVHLYELARLCQSGEVDWRHQGVDWRLGLSPALANAWFGGGEPPLLPGVVAYWIERYAASPLEREFRPNKDELWLHLELASGWRSKTAIARRRLFPVKLPGRLEGQFEAGPPSAGERARRTLRYVAFVAGRALYHARSAMSAAVEGVRWFALKKRRRPEAGVISQTPKKERFS